LSHVLGLERILLDHYKPKTCIIWSKVCLIVYKKNVSNKGLQTRRKKKEAGTFVLPAITTMCTYNIGVLQSQEFCIIFFNLFSC
jgi:hypothetical protein